MTNNIMTNNIMTNNKDKKQLFFSHNWGLDNNNKDNHERVK